MTVGALVRHQSEAVVSRSPSERELVFAIMNREENAPRQPNRADIRDSDGPYPVVPRGQRQSWMELDDQALLAQCQVDAYGACGPGGQKRNRKRSAIRLRHQPTGLMVQAEESRSQTENRLRAVRRLRERLALRIREPVGADESLAIRPETLACGPRTLAYWQAVARSLDVLYQCGAQLRATAERLGIGIAPLVKFWHRDPKVWEEVQRLRQWFHLSPLRHT